MATVPDIGKVLQGAVEHGDVPGIVALAATDRGIYGAFERGVYKAFTAE